ncbi:hypothetical protein ACQPZJ_43865 [Actinoplanes sp. CA-054009]
MKSPGARDYRVVEHTANRDAKTSFATPATTTKATPPATGGGGGGLPITGAPIAGITLVGGLLVALGAALPRLGRRRHGRAFLIG